MEVKFKKLNEKAVTPSYAKQGDAGLDIFCTDIVYTEDYIECKTGLAFEVPEGYVGLLFPRSSISKKHMSLCNSVGVLDSGYRGEVTFRFRLNAGGYKKYAAGEAIGQLVILPYPKIELVESELSDTERGSGGYGSSNR